MNDLVSHLQSLDPPAFTVVLLAVASLVLVLREPITGRRSFARFRVEEAAEGEPARLRHYRSWTLQGCTSAILAVALVLALPGVGLADIGARWPSWPSGGSVASSAVRGMIAGVLLMIVVVALAMLVRRWRSRRAAASAPTAAAVSDESEAPAAETRGQMAAVLPMLPRTAAGRRGWAMLSLSAGVTEEITYRGLLLLTLAVVLPSDAPTALLVTVAAVSFGLAHWYQGWTGIVSTGIFGALMSGLFLVTGSLLLPMVLHTLVDLRALMLPVPAEPATTQIGTTADREATSGTTTPTTTAPRPDPS